MRLTHLIQHTHWQDNLISYWGPSNVLHPLMKESRKTVARRFHTSPNGTISRDWVSCVASMWIKKSGTSCPNFFNMLAPLLLGSAHSWPKSALCWGVTSPIFVFYRLNWMCFWCQGGPALSVLAVMWPPPPFPSNTTTKPIVPTPEGLPIPACIVKHQLSSPDQEAKPALSSAVQCFALVMKGLFGICAFQTFFLTK